jgi:hypothetical protein
VSSIYRERKVDRSKWMARVLSWPFVNAPNGTRCRNEMARSQRSVLCVLPCGILFSDKFGH